MQDGRCLTYLEHFMSILFWFCGLLPFTVAKLESTLLELEFIHKPISEGQKGWDFDLQRMHIPYEVSAHVVRQFGFKSCNM